MSEYREHWNLTADPPMAAVYARLADAHERSEAERAARNRVGRTVDLRRSGVRPRLAGALRRLATAIEPAPATCGSDAT